VRLPPFPPPPHLPIMLRLTCGIDRSKSVEDCLDDEVDSSFLFPGGAVNDTRNLRGHVVSVYTSVEYSILVMKVDERRGLLYSFKVVVVVDDEGVAGITRHQASLLSFN
jgi:hypothetical protein